MQTQASNFLESYLETFTKLAVAEESAAWVAANSGTNEAFAVKAQAAIALRKFHSAPERYQQVVSLRKHESQYDTLTVRSLQLTELAFKENQLPPALLEQIINLTADIEHIYSNFRPMLNGQLYSNNDLLTAIQSTMDSQKRQQCWEGLKQVGAQVGSKLVSLAKLRNQAAQSLEYANFWDMKVRLQEYDPDQLLAIFDELDKLTSAPFKAMKTKLDLELAKRFKINFNDIMPWHYDNPFFQQAPPSAEIDLNNFYKDKTREQIVAIAQTFYADIGLAVEDILARSDLYERPGKDQHAYSFDINRQNDVRILTNIKPTSDWMETLLHELGHAVYSLGIDATLPFNLRKAANPFTTEGVAMMFGALAGNPTWMVQYAKADAARIDSLADIIHEQRQRDQLIFARWVLVMLHFEKAMYEDPDRNLNLLWWDLVEQYQMLQRPGERNRSDWAAKPHFTIAPVYYHNYMLGELFASQLRAKLAEIADHQGSIANLSFRNRKDFGLYLQDQVFSPGKRLVWPEFVSSCTGGTLTPRYFTAEITNHRNW